MLVADFTTASTVVAASNSDAANSISIFPSGESPGTAWRTTKVPAALERVASSPLMVMAMSFIVCGPITTTPRSVRKSPRATGSSGSTTISGTPTSIGQCTRAGPSSLLPGNSTLTVVRVSSLKMVSQENPPRESVSNTDLERPSASMVNGIPGSGRSSGPDNTPVRWYASPTRTTSSPVIRMKTGSVALNDIWLEAGSRRLPPWNTASTECLPGWTEASRNWNAPWESLSTGART